MPNMPARACSYPGCPQLVNDGGRCATHAYQRKRDDRPSAAKRGYGGEWPKIRARYLREHPVCELRIKCRGARATQVDHDKTLDSGGSNAPHNLRAACARCHSSKTATKDTSRDTGGRFHGRSSNIHQ